MEPPLEVKPPLEPLVKDDDDGTILVEVALQMPPGLQITYISVSALRVTIRFPLYDQIPALPHTVEVRGKAYSYWRFVGYEGASWFANPDERDACNALEALGDVDM